MKSLLYVYQNYRKSYSSASLSILRALHSLKGFKIEDFEVKPISYSNFINRILNKVSFIRTRHFKVQNELLMTKVGNGCYDYMFVMKGTDIKSDTLLEIKKKNPSIKLICFNPDDPFNRASSNEEIIKSIAVYDYYCIWTRHLDLKLKAAGANHIKYLPFGVDETIIYPLDAEYKYEISFVGNGDDERHQLIRGLALEFERRNLMIRIHIFGSNWPDLGSNVIVDGQKNAEDLLKTIAASKINLNLLRKQNKNSINMRTFEIPAARGFMLHERSDEAQSFFTSNTEVVYFDDVVDLANKCEYYLKNEEERKGCVTNCNKKLKSVDYSYQKIMDNVFNQL